MAYQMSIVSPGAAAARFPYSRLPSDVSMEHTPDAIHGPLARRGDPQPQHRVPHWFYILVLKPFLRWLVTLAFTASIYGTLNYYERRGSFSPNDKQAINGITTTLILGLGLNLLVSRNST